MYKNRGGIKVDGKKHLGLLINIQLHEKLKMLAEYNARSLSREIIHLIQRGIKEHEDKNGPLI